VNEISWHESEESSKEEVLEWHADDGRGHIDRDIGHKWSEPQEEDIEEEIVALLLDLLNMIGRLIPSD
jgi:hypothetical protein